MQHDLWQYCIIKSHHSSCIGRKNKIFQKYCECKCGLWKYNTTCSRCLLFIKAFLYLFFFFPQTCNSIDFTWFKKHVWSSVSLAARNFTESDSFYSVLTFEIKLISPQLFLCKLYIPYVNLMLLSINFSNNLIIVLKYFNDLK